MAAKSEFLSCKFVDVSAANDTREFTGYGAVFGNVDQGGDVIVPGAFSASLRAHAEAGSAPMMFWAHDPSRVPGRWLRMKEDAKGLHVHGWLAPTALGDEARVLLRSGSVNGLSIGFVPNDTDYDRAGNRLLKSVALWECSLVSLPMNAEARVDTSSVKDDIFASEFENTERELWKLSRSQARRYAHTALKALRAVKNGEQGALDDLHGSLESATVLALIEQATNKIRSL